MSFVRLENLNDFIQPTSTCIKPPQKSAGLVAKVSDINLSDCLACSGCITSAESVLVQQQNHDELFRVINAKKTSKTNLEIVVTLSLQSIASLAYKSGISTQDAAERLASFFLSIGCDKVYDINLARHLSLIESYREYKQFQSEKDKSNLPIINSVCPGWICYAEKTNGELIIPHLSKVRSPQQIMGSLLKRSHAVSQNLIRKDIYHVTLMPCFDKKLEASRVDFKTRDTGSGEMIHDVDCVLTPIELEEILNDEGVTLLDMEPRKLDTLIDTGLEFDLPLTSHFGSVSGGYAENILAAEASEILGRSEKEFHEQIEYSVLKNNDFIELTLSKKDHPSQVVRRLAIVNGFRNIQTVVQRLKRNALRYDYIEIMACPSGCINGGAQCKPNRGDEKLVAIEETKKLYKEIASVSYSISSDDVRKQIYARLNINEDQIVDRLLYTSFHAVPKTNSLTVQNDAFETRVILLEPFVDSLVSTSCKRIGVQI